MDGPVHRFGTGGSYHPFPEFCDQAGLFRHRDEFGRRDGPALGLVPAKQRLAGDDLVSLEIDDRLIVQFELSLGERRAQIELEIPPRRHPLMHGGFEKPVRAATAGLGAVERQIGVLEQLVGVGAVVGRNCNADTGIDHDLAVIEVIRQRNRVAEPSGKSFRVRGFGDLGLDDRKLVAAEPRHQVGFPDAVAQAVRDRSQQIVADRMAQRVVDILEVVEDRGKERPAARHG